MISTLYAKYIIDLYIRLLLPLTSLANMAVKTGLAMMLLLLPLLVVIGMLPLLPCLLVRLVSGMWLPSLLVSGVPLLLPVLPLGSKVLHRCISSLPLTMPTSYI